MQLNIQPKCHQVQPISFFVDFILMITLSNVQELTSGEKIRHYNSLLGNSMINSIKFDNRRLIIFRRNFFFERKIFNSVVGFFFLGSETAHDAQTLLQRR